MKCPHCNQEIFGESWKKVNQPEALSYLRSADNNRNNASSVSLVFNDVIETYTLHAGETKEQDSWVSGTLEVLKFEDFNNADFFKNAKDIYIRREPPEMLKDSLLSTWWWR